MAKTAYGLSPKLSRQVSEGESFLRDDLAATPVVQARPMSPARPVVPYGQAYAANGQPDGRAVMGNGFLGAYPMINTKNPTLVVLPPYVDSFSRIQDRLARFYTMFAPMFAQMAQQARASAGRAVRGMGSGGKPKAQPKADNFEDKGSWNAYIPGMDMRMRMNDRDSFGLRQPGVRPNYQLQPPVPGMQWWQVPPTDTTTAPSAPAPRKVQPPQVDSGASAAAGFGVVEPTPLLPEGSFPNRWIRPGANVEPMGATVGEYLPVLPYERVPLSKFEDMLRGK